MSRRLAPTAAQERAAQNQVTIKTLLKLEGNKSCADCKRNKHPRWASWNLGVFVCIRCSGIHRGMGTHISRVKSVDLDAWTDEQLQSVLKWGNTRANKYWEDKLAPGHVPSDAKIENFIRTKYESKRWVMDGPMPDPTTLDVAGDDDVPLNIVQEKAKLDRSSTQSRPTASNGALSPPPRASAHVDLFGDVPEPPARPSTTGATTARAPPPKPPAQSKMNNNSDSLLGLDFFGGGGAAGLNKSASSASTSGLTTNQARPDLKQSILSLYASTPKSQATPQPDSQNQAGKVPVVSSGQPSGSQDLNGAFSNLNFNPSVSSAPKPAQSSGGDLFSSYSPANVLKRSSAVAPQITSPPPLSGGSFFDADPKSVSRVNPTTKAAAKPQANLAPIEASDFGDFSFSPSPAVVPIASKTNAPASSMDLFSMDDPTPPAASVVQPQASTTYHASPFNLSSNKPATVASKQTASAQPSANFGAFSNADAWATDDAWSTPDPPPAPATSQKSNPVPAALSKPPAIPMTNDFSAWGGSEPVSQPAVSSTESGPPPKVMQDEDYGGWSSAAPKTVTSSQPAPAPPATKPAGSGFGGGDDLFSNVWE